MATSVTLTAVSITTEKNYISCINSNDYKNQENIISPITNKSVERSMPSSKQSLIKSAIKTDNSLNQSLPKFRIPKITRPNNIMLSADANQLFPTEMKMETSTCTSPPISNRERNSLSINKSNDEFNSPQGKRKLSLSQYKEHKRLKSNDIIENFSADVDMRINTMENTKNSPPTVIDEDSAVVSENQVVVSPKMENISKDRVFIKSNLSEPGLKNIRKKKLIWADEKNQALVQTLFFELDDTEVADMHAFARQCAANISIAQVEKLWERDLRKQQSLENINSSDNDDRQNLLSWPTLIRILLPDTIVQSQKRLAQQEREKNVLKTHCTPSFLPDRTGEPNGDLLGNSTSASNEPKLIPLDNNTASLVSNQVSSLNNNNSTSTNIPLVSTSPTSNLSSSSLDIISPEVARILAQAKENSATVTANNLSSLTVNTQNNPSTTITSTNPPLASIQNFLSSLLNTPQPNETNTINIPPTNSTANLVSNPPVNVNLTIPTNFTINQLLANVIPFSTTPTPFNNSIIQSSSARFNPSPSIPITTAINPNNNSAIKSPIVPFLSDLDHQSSRFNNNNEHQNRNSFHNNRGHNYRRGLYNNNNYNHRNYYQNRNNNNNYNKRNIFPLI
ncbi:unnamed protein product [Rotaria sp. Silwood2]|nr:unnamed protein product [Rotaria sp. Silwood2]